MLVLGVIEFGISPLVYPMDAYTFTAVLEKLYNLGMCLCFMTLISVCLCTMVHLNDKSSLYDNAELKLLETVE